MHSDASNPLLSSSRSDRLRLAVREAHTDAARLEALLELARYFADTADGVNGLASAREARWLALEQRDMRAVSHSLISASVSQYHRSDYVGAVATAMDAWDYAHRAQSAYETTESFFAIGLSLTALGEFADAMRVVEQGLALAATPDLRVPQVGLIALNAMICFQLGRWDETETWCLEAIDQSTGLAADQLSLNHGDWGIALLRESERRIAQDRPIDDLLPRSRTHLQIALDLAEADGDTMRVADRISGLGQVALLEGKLDEAEKHLTDAIRRSQTLDYVRTAAISAKYLGRLYLKQGDIEQAVTTLRMAVSQARRGAPGDTLPALMLLLADALEQKGGSIEALSLREMATKMQEDDAGYRRRAAEDAKRLAAQVLAR